MNQNQNFIKDIIFDKEAKEKVLKGVETLSKAVKSTLGPCGKNVIIENMYTSPTITKDGVTVARQIALKDKFENIGANLVKEVAAKTANAAGDGTTTATVLAEFIYKHGLQALKSGVNPNQLKKGIDDCVNILNKKLGKFAIKVKDQKTLTQIATISANGDEVIGKVIAEAIKAVGVDGTVTVSNSKTNETYWNIIKGMEFSNGFLSPYFITNETKGTCEFENPFILLLGKKVQSINELLPLLQWIAQQKKPLLIICDDMETEVLSTIIINKIKGVVNACVVKSPSFGDIRKEVMMDIAILTNGTYIDEDLGMSLDSANYTILGSAKQVIVTSNSTTIIDGNGDQEAINERINNIKQKLENSTNQYEQQNLKRRLSKLTNGVAMIYAGANTVVELNEKKDRIDDALHATTAAVEEGIVPGGGVALIKAAKMAKTEIKRAFKNNPTAAYREGFDIVMTAIQEPLKQIAANGDYCADLVLAKVEKNVKPYFGFDALNNKYVDLVKAGIIDPVKVTRTALQSASSIAGLLLTTECVVAIDEGPEQNNVNNAM